MFDYAHYWIGRLTPYVLLIGFLFSVYKSIERKGIDYWIFITYPVAFWLFFCFLAYIVCAFLQPLFESMHNGAGFKKGALAGLVSLIALLLIFDIGLARGSILVNPLISLMLYQSLDGTFWGCDNYVSVDEGNFCADDW